MMAERYEDQYRDRDRGRRGDRGFMERAGDEVRSWFGDDDAERRRQMDDREQDRDRFRDQLYGQSSDYRRGYGDRSYENRGYGERSYGDRGYENRGYGERSYGDRSQGDRGFSDRGYGYGSGFRGAGEGYGMYSGTGSGAGYGGGTSYSRDYGSGYGSGYRDEYGRGSGSSFAGAGERGSGSYGGQFGFGEGRGMGYSGRGPKGYQRSDARINEDVCDRLCDSPDIDASDIEVSVNQGEVTLSGSVDDREVKRRAEDLVERISGVREVHNNLRVNRGQSTGSASGSVTGTTSTGSIGASGSGGDVAHPGITGGGPSGATNISTSGNVTGGAAGAPENPLGLRDTPDQNTRTSTAGGRR
jgi:osmotically-inducible protein OsmY